jgi:sialidase-1
MHVSCYMNPSAVVVEVATKQSRSGRPVSSDTTTNDSATLRTGSHGVRHPTALPMPSPDTRHSAVVLAFAEARWPSCGDFDCKPDPRLGGAAVCGRHDVVLKRSTDGGVSWGDPIVVARVDSDFGSASSPNSSIFNIAPVVDARTPGRVVVLVNLQPAQYNTLKELYNPKARETYALATDDAGLTWTLPLNITSQLQQGGPAWAESRNPQAVTPGPGIQLSDGTLLVPGYGCPLPAFAACVTYSVNSTMRAWALRSTDGGGTWTMGDHAPAVGAAEPMAIVRADGVVVINARSVQWPHDDKPHPQRHRIYTTSNDGGLTWSLPPPGAYADLTGPSCEASFIRSGDLVLFANPANNIKRVNMTFRVSRDWGSTWESSTIAYANSSWYSSIAVVGSGVGSRTRADGGSADETDIDGASHSVGAAATSTALLFFVKDCDSPITTA